jgi:hypothetical protein
MAIGFASPSSTLQGTYCFTMGGVSTFLSWPAFTRVSLAVRTRANLPSLSSFRLSTSSISRVTLCPQPLPAELSPKHSCCLAALTTFSLFLSHPPVFLSATRSQTLTAMTELPILTTKPCFERWLDQITCWTASFARTAPVAAFERA